jgi:chaperonin GroES
MRLFNDRYIVRPIQPDEKTAGGLVLPKTAKSMSYNRSVVVLVGEGFPATATAPARPNKAKIGDVVMHHSLGIDHDYNGERLKLITEGELIGIE